jgi:nucleotide-binding universal stress UspA family protein
MACAVHLAAAKETHMSSPSKPYVIVVAVDYSEAGALALERAFELAVEKPAAALHVINVIPLAPSSYTPEGSALPASSLPTLAEGAAQLHAYVELRIAMFRAAHAGQNLTALDGVRTHQRVEIPSEEIAQLAADVEADLVVVGTHGRRGLTRLMLGSVAEATVRLAPCPVLVVRPKAVPAAVPAIEPPCPRCLETRAASGGKQFWCSQHSERHGQRHTYHQGDRMSSDGSMPLVMRS